MHYLRTSRSTDAQRFDTADDAIRHVQMNIARQRSQGRTVSRRKGGEQIQFHEKSGELFDAMWVEDEDGNHVHVHVPSV